MNIYIRKSFTFLRLIWGAIRFPVFRLFVKVPQIMSIDETLDFVINNNTSVARFGDSEYLYMMGKGDGIQKADDDLQVVLIVLHPATHADKARVGDGIERLLSRVPHPRGDLRRAVGDKGLDVVFAGCRRRQLLARQHVDIIDQIAGKIVAQVDSSHRPRIIPARRTPP